MIAVLLVLLLAVQSPESPSEPPSGADRTEAGTLYTLGAQLYDEGDFRGAAAAFEGAAATGWTSPQLELGLGAAYFEAGELGRAVLHFERAHRLAPRDPDVRQNLRLARDAAGTALPTRTPADAAARWLSATAGAGIIASVAFALYLVVLGLLAFRVWTGTMRTDVRRALIVLVPLLVLASIAAVGTARFEAHPRAVVVADAADVLAQPSGTAGTTATASEGTVLVVTGTREGWRAVRLPDGATGWVAASTVEEV